ncbi:MAG TPA: hypothetical protein VM533_16790 [Fimbriiglobus sp.]|jgi:hypothetical protein|nr:hypothetical protein [Fimbriiglobus sp.]
MTEPQTIDVTGLPAPVVASLRHLVDGLRVALPAAGGTPPVPPHQLSVEERLRLFNEWVNAPRPPAPPFVDDSRESIYEGRGE